MVGGVGNVWGLAWGVGSGRSGGNGGGKCQACTRHTHEYDHSQLCAGHLLVALLLAAAAVNTCADGASGDGAAPAPAEAPAAVGGAHPTRVLVQFKAAAAATARAQAAQPLKGLQLKRLLGKHQGVDVRAASAATAGRGPPQALPADGVYLFEITDALPVKDKIKELLATSGKCWGQEGGVLVGA